MRDRPRSDPLPPVHAPAEHANHTEVFLSVFSALGCFKALRCVCSCRGCSGTGPPVVSCCSPASPPAAARCALRVVLGWFCSGPSPRVCSGPGKQQDRRMPPARALCEPPCPRLQRVRGRGPGRALGHRAGSPQPPQRPPQNDLRAPTPAAVRSVFLQAGYLSVPVTPAGPAGTRPAAGTQPVLKSFKRGVRHLSAASPESLPTGSDGTLSSLNTFCRGLVSSRS